MTDPAHESSIRDAQFRAIRYGLAAVVFAVLSIAAATASDWEGVVLFGVVSLLTVSYSLLTVRLTEASLRRG